MSNVINLFNSEGDLNNCSYFSDEYDAIGLTMRDRSLSVRPLSATTVEVMLGKEYWAFQRGELAEFLKVAAILVDSEDRWLPEVELIGMNYE